LKRKDPGLRLLWALSAVGHCRVCLHASARGFPCVLDCGPSLAGTPKSLFSRGDIQVSTRTRMARAYSTCCAQSAVDASVLCTTGLDAVLCSGMAGVGRRDDRRDCSFIAHADGYLLR